jgi:hypothetical protein
MKGTTFEVLTHPTLEVVTNEVKRLRKENRIMQLVLATLLIGGAAIGATNQPAGQNSRRFQITANNTGDMIHRVDTLTGQMEIFIVRPAHSQLEMKLKYLQAATLPGPRNSDIREDGQ